VRHIALHRPLIGLCTLQELQVLAQVPSVGLNRVGGEPTLDIQGEEVLIDTL
jgi:hypothetical protein